MQAIGKTALGFLYSPTRPTGVYYYSELPNLYQSLWPYYPKPKTFKKALITNRSRQYNINTQSEFISKHIKYMLSDNPACVGNIMTSDDCIPKPGEELLLS